MVRTRWRHLVTLKQIVALPDALVKRACEECGHPEMRSLPDGTFHCPACRSEVVSTESNLSAAASATRKKANNAQEVLESRAEEGRESRVS